MNKIFKRVGMVAVRFFWVWLAIFLGDVLVWSAYAYTQAEPTRTFTFNFISSNIPFLAGLSTGGAIIITLILEITDYFKSGPRCTQRLPGLIAGVALLTACVAFVSLIGSASVASKIDVVDHTTEAPPDIGVIER